MSFTDAQGTVAAREMWLEFGPGGVRGHSFVNGFWHYLRYCSGARLTYGSGARQLLGSTPDEEALDGRFFTAVSMIRRYARNNDSLELRSEDGYIVVRLDSDAPSVAPTQALARPRSADDDNPTSYPYPPPPCP